MQGKNSLAYAEIKKTIRFGNSYENIMLGYTIKLADKNNAHNCGHFEFHTH
jgi:hypothetical protein